MHMCLHVRIALWSKVPCLIRVIKDFLLSFKLKFSHFAVTLTRKHGVQMREGIRGR